MPHGRPSELRTWLVSVAKARATKRSRRLTRWVHPRGKAIEERIFCDGTRIVLRPAALRERSETRQATADNEQNHAYDQGNALLGVQKREAASYPVKGCCLSFLNTRFGPFTVVTIVRPKVLGFRHVPWLWLTSPAHRGGNYVVEESNAGFC